MHSWRARCCRFLVDMVHLNWVWCWLILVQVTSRRTTATTLMLQALGTCTRTEHLERESFSGTEPQRAFCCSHLLSWLLLAPELGMISVFQRLLIWSVGRDAQVVQESWGALLRSVVGFISHQPQGSKVEPWGYYLTCLMYVVLVGCFVVFFPTGPQVAQAIFEFSVTQEWPWTYPCVHMYSVCKCIHQCACRSQRITSAIFPLGPSLLIK